MSKFFLSSALCLALLPGLVQAQPVKVGSVKVRVEVEIEGVLVAKGQDFSILVHEQGHEPQLLLPKLVEKHWALDFSAAKDLQPLAKELAGKVVSVRGMAVLRGVTTTTVPMPAPMLLPGDGLPLPQFLHSSSSTLDLEPRVAVQGLTVVKPVPKDTKKTANPPAAPGPVLKNAKNLLPLLKGKDDKDGEKEKLRQRLAKTKVPTENDARTIAVEYKFKTAGGILAEEGLVATGLFASGDDLIWVVRFPLFLSNPLRQAGEWEVWVNATTGEARHHQPPAEGKSGAFNAFNFPR